MDSASPPDNSGGYIKPVPRGSPPIHEDFVMVPENVPSDHSGMKTEELDIIDSQITAFLPWFLYSLPTFLSATSGSSPRGSSVDLNAIFR